MAEIIVFMRDGFLKGEPIFDSKVARRGDTIAAVPDDWPWGVDELSMDIFRIVKMPKVSIEAAEMLTAPEIPVDLTKPNRTLQYRMNKFDLASAVHSPEFLVWAADDTRKDPMFVADYLTDATILDVTVKKPVIDDPAVVVPVVVIPRR